MTTPINMNKTHTVKSIGGKWHAIFKDGVLVASFTFRRFYWQGELRCEGTLNLVDGTQTSLDHLGYFKDVKAMAEYGLLA
jgi:hypothetical protein